MTTARVTSLGVLAAIKALAMFSLLRETKFFVTAGCPSRRIHLYGYVPVDLLPQHVVAWRLIRRLAYLCSKTRNANAVAQRENTQQIVRASLPYYKSNRRSSRVLTCRRDFPHPRRFFPPQALQSASGKHKVLLSPERAYCLFRMERLEEALDVARSSGGTVEGSKRVNALRQLEAQVQRYRVWPSRS